MESNKFFADRDSPVKRANWWTKWKRRADRRYQTTAERSNSTLLYLISLCVLTAGASYAAVPLYRIFCQTSGYGGTTQIGHDADKVETMETKKDRLLTIKFTADTAATMQWNFKPQQYSIDVYAGETALAFYTVSQMFKFKDDHQRIGQTLLRSLSTKLDAIQPQHSMDNYANQIADCFTNGETEDFKEWLNLE